MKIVYIDIQNFRKLKTCRIELAGDSTIFVGANNSGKTSAMDALIMFLKKTKRKELSITDISLSNWSAINQIGKEWVNMSERQPPKLTLDSWRSLLPAIDIWLEVDESQIQYVSHILPTLSWDGGLLGIRLILEPKDIEKLYKAYVNAYSGAYDRNKTITPSLWSVSMRDFLDRKLQELFTINAYVLDPKLVDGTRPQPFTELMEALDGDPIDGLFKVDIINAQRGFSDSNTGEGIANNDRRLSAQLRNYFDKHLNPNEQPNENELGALVAIESARIAFDQKLKDSFASAIGELESLNYPGFSNPEILLSSKINPLDSLKHESAVQFKVTQNETPDDTFYLPEKYNGLGYQNLISMVFNLIRFRDEWMRVGNAGKREEANHRHIEPLHLMLIEEPEAHLHAQVQQVFIKKAFDVLRNHDDLKEKQQFTTQMIISTHSSHIAHEADFTGLRYFRRNPLSSENGFDMPSADVVNMSTVFGNKKDKDQIKTAQFATRYLKTTHCDLFFADAAILVEGPAERMLVPGFIRERYEKLNKSYISLLEIGGSHAHRLRPLVESLGIPTLVITDLDSIEAESSSKTRPIKGEGLKTGNSTLKHWAPNEEFLDEVLNASPEDKMASNGKVRVAYPCETEVLFNGETVKAIPYTFEDALVLANLEEFKNMKGIGLIKKMAEASNQKTLETVCKSMFDKLKESAKKAEMALELLYWDRFNTLTPPQYISEGLDWLENTINHSLLKPEEKK